MQKLFVKKLFKAYLIIKQSQGNLAFLFCCNENYFFTGGNGPCHRIFMIIHWLIYPQGAIAVKTVRGRSIAGAGFFCESQLDFSKLTEPSTSPDL